VAIEGVGEATMLVASRCAASIPTRMATTTCVVVVAATGPRGATTPSHCIGRRVSVVAASRLLLKSKFITQHL
jgi:hypothetical protein